MILATAAIASKYWHKLMGAAIQARSGPTTRLLAPPLSAPVNAGTGSLYSNIRVGQTTGAPMLIRKEENWAMRGDKRDLSDARPDGRGE